MIHGVEKPTKQTVLFGLHMLYFYMTIVHSLVRFVLFRKLRFYLPLKPTKLNQIKNDNSFKVLMSCTIYLNFISKVQPPNEKLRLVMSSVIYSEQEIKLNSVGFDMHESPPVWFLWRLLLNAKIIIQLLKRINILVMGVKLIFNNYWFLVLLNLY